MRSIAWRALLMRAGLAPLLALALGGCASQAGQTSAVVSSPTATANRAAAGTPDGAAGASSSPTPAIVPTATLVVIPGTPGAYAPACQARQLSLSIGFYESQSGTSDGMGTVTNHFSTACSLFGFPGAQLLDAQRAPMATQVSRSTRDVVQHVQVAPGASAYFAVVWSAAPTGAQTSCPAVGYFAMTPPGDSNVVIASAPIHPCDGAITISPFLNSPTMSS